MKKTYIISLLMLGALCASAMDKKEIYNIMWGVAPIPDRVNVNHRVYEEAVEATWQAMQEMPWGKSVPEREFKHFVVPLRVNNEPIDGHRPVIYAELKDRVKGLSMKDAILEVNHWCHEYVTYQPSDSRTHTPLQSMSSCIGRCGEESTFTVAALRSVGIPARQVYTPRWAHTDDNHAWVEAWADGQWYFLGACEPEPVLNLAWFNAPATRGMMMHTFVRGDYDGPEEVAERRKDGVVINVTSNYAPVAETVAIVTDEKGNPVENADVSFSIYNYGEFYPLTVKKSDAEGRASVVTGLGDMIVWASKPGEKGYSFGFTKLKAGTDNNVKVKMAYNEGKMPSKPFEFDFIPPKQGSNIVTPTPEARAANDIRFAYEDSVRKSRTDQFIDEKAATQIAKKFQMPEKRTADVLKHARGNSEKLYRYIRKTPALKRKRLLSLLETLSEKDLSDITAEVLDDHMRTPVYQHPLYYKYIMSPRISNEDLSAWRTPLMKGLPKFESASKLAEWVKQEIQIIDDWTPTAIYLHPDKVLIAKKANARSRDIFFVAAARSQGFPARIDPMTGATQWFNGDSAKTGEWVNVDWNADKQKESTPKGKLKLLASASNRNDDPAYYYQFSISRLENGKPRQLEFDENAKMSGEFSEPIELECGDYQLVTGQRLANGGVLAKMDLFTIEPDQEKTVELKIRHDDTAVEVIGSLNSEDLYTPVTKEGTEQPQKSMLSTTGRGFYVLGILNTGHEPSNHTVRDIAAVKAEFEELGIPMLFLFAEGNKAKAFFDDKQLPELPAQANFGLDKDNKIFKELRDNLKLGSNDKPLFVIADTFNRVVFVSQGYTIGLGRTILDTIKKI